MSVFHPFFVTFTSIQKKRALKEGTEKKCDEIFLPYIASEFVRNKIRDKTDKLEIFSVTYVGVIQASPYEKLHDIERGALCTITQLRKRTDVTIS